MKIYIGADHRGFELKNKLITYLKSKSIEIEDLGNTIYDAGDDFPDYAQPVAQVVQKEKTALGIVICGSAVGVSVAANRYRGVYCALGFDPDQVKSARQHDHVNVLALPSDYTPIGKAQVLVDIFISTMPLEEEKYTRRLKKVDSI